MSTNATIDLPNAVRAVFAALNTIDAEKPLDWHCDERVELSGIGTRYGCGIESAPRDLVPKINQQKLGTARVSLERYSKILDHGDDVWTGRIGQTVVDIEMELPAGDDFSRGSISILVPLNEEAAARALEEQAANAIDNWIGEHCGRLAREITTLTPERIGAQIPLVFQRCEQALYRRLLTALSTACAEELAKL
jgi:hypothetical protein